MTDWLLVEDGGYVTNVLYFVCGRNYRGDRVMDFALWHDRQGGWDLATNSFEPRFYAVVEWPLELADDGEGV